MVCAIETLGCDGLRRAVEGPAMTPNLYRRTALGLLATVALLVAGAADPPLLEKKIEFDKEDGEEAFRLDPEGSEVELQTAGGKKRLATYEKKGSELTIELPKIGAAGSVSIDEKRERFSIKDNSGTVKWLLLREPDADWKLTNAKEELKLKLKLRDDGYKMVDADDAKKGTVKVGEERISARNSKGKVLLRTKDTRSALAVACFTLEGLTLPEKGALAIAILTWPPKVTE